MNIRSCQYHLKAEICAIDFKKVGWYIQNMTLESLQTEEASPEKEGVIRALLANHEDLSPLHQFLGLRETRCKNGMDSLLLSVDLLDICVGAHLYEAAHETLNAALLQAEQEDAAAIFEYLEGVRRQLLQW